MSSDINVFYTTCGSVKQSKELAKAVLNDKLVVCVNLIKNIESYYKDSGSIKKSNESILIIKTFLSKTKVENLIKKNHPYDIPFVIQLETKNVNRKYLSWAIQTDKS